MAFVYRIHSDEAYFRTLIVRFWRLRPLLLRPWITYAVLAAVTSVAWILAPWQSVIWTYVYVTAAGFALALGPGAYYLTRMLILNRFRQYRSFGHDSTYTLSESGLQIEGPLGTKMLNWSDYPRAARYSDGILLVRPGTICWLPDSALGGSAAADATALVEAHTELQHVA